MAIETEGLARSFRFTVNIHNKGSGPDIGQIGFNSVSGIGDETDSLEYREGDDSDVIHEYDGLTTINEVDLEKGYIYGNQQVMNLIKWRYHGSDVSGSITIDGETPNLDIQANTSMDVASRRDVTVTLNDASNNPRKEWFLEDCSCRALDLSDFDGESSDALIQTFTIKPEGIKIRNP